MLMVEPSCRYLPILLNKVGIRNFLIRTKKSCFSGFVYFQALGLKLGLSLCSTEILPKPKPVSSISSFSLRWLFVILKALSCQAFLKLKASLPFHLNFWLQALVLEPDTVAAVTRLLNGTV